MLRRSAFGQGCEPQILHLSVCFRSSSTAGSCSGSVGMVMNSIATVSVSGMRVRPCDSRTPTGDLCAHMRPYVIISCCVLAIAPLSRQYAITYCFEIRTPT